MSNYIASKLDREFILGARARLHRSQTLMLEKTGWTPHKSDYDGVTRWYYESVGLLSRVTAIDLAMDEIDINYMQTGETNVNKTN